MHVWKKKKTFSMYYEMNFSIDQTLSDEVHNVSNKS